MRVAWFAAIFVLFSCTALSYAQGLRETPIDPLDREHWSFQPLKRPSIPAVKDEAGWARTPVDAFILQRLEAKQIAPAKEAVKSVLLRRLTFDLTGLPPSPEEIAAFEADHSPQAYERVVDRLLASPHYGERMAQVWLDLARFAETDGFEHDRVRKDAWKYRDWVIGALNRDLPYDEFLALQLAGDELRPGDEEAKIATMFCLSGPDMPDLNDQTLRRHNLLNEMASTVGSVTMALQFGCAQCHDHKYDPISQADFFRLRAFFDPALAVKRDQLVSTLEEKSAQAPPSFLYLRGDVTRPADQLSPAYPRIVNEADTPVPSPGKGAKSTQRRTALAKWLTRKDHPLTSRVIANRLWQQHFGRGLSKTPSDFGVVGAEPTHPELLDWLAVELVEHDWSLKHLQRLIVTSAVYRQSAGVPGSGFGVQEGNSADSSPNPEPRTPNPSLYATFPRQRLSAEMIRDAMLAASGQLSVTAGGPGVLPPLAKEVEITLLKDQWKVSDDPADHVRRSVYIFARRNLRYPLLEAFDKADPNQSCAARHISTTAPQALNMLNSRFSLDCARHLAGRALTESEGDADRAIGRVYLHALARSPTEAESTIARQFLAAQAKLIADDGRPLKQLALPVPAVNDLPPAQAAALVDFSLAVLNSSEFIYLD